MKKILVTGPRGFVGSRIMERYPDAVAAPSLRNMTEDALRRLLAEIQPDCIIHTAAVSDMGQCEADPEGSYYANVTLPVLLTRANPGAKLVLFSSDQVYNGAPEPGPYRENQVCPANRYARQKLEMEQRVLELDPGAVMLRAEWMYDYIAPKGNYFLNVVNSTEPPAFSASQYRGVTYVREVAEAMDAVMALPGGAYNFGSETDSTIQQITQEFLRHLGREPVVCDRPGGHNLWMDCTKARSLGVQFSTVLEGLKRCTADSGILKR